MAAGGCTRRPDEGIHPADRCADAADLSRASLREGLECLPGIRAQTGRLLRRQFLGRGRRLTTTSPRSEGSPRRTVRMFHEQANVDPRRDHDGVGTERRVQQQQQQRRKQPASPRSARSTERSLTAR